MTGDEAAGAAKPTSALYQRLATCGPVVDAGAQTRAREALEEAAKAGAWGEVLAAAWSALAPVFAASPYLLGLARRRPEDLRTVLCADPAALSARIIAAAAAPPGDEPAASVERRLRRLKARLHLLTALADLGGVFSLEEVTGALSDFARAALSCALALAAREAHEAGRLERLGDDAEGPLPGFFCLAMGKLGADELNYSSDIDISVFYEPAALPLAGGAEPAAAAARITERIADVLRRRTPDGYVFRVDLRLRPNPATTPPAVSVAAAFEYYESVGQNWERAAFIKATPAAGDMAAARAFLTELEPFVWRRNLDFAAIADIHSIRRQIDSRVGGETPAAAGADLKLGRGGIREIEFWIQTQQLILGGRQRELRQASTLAALAALTASGHATARLTGELAVAYRELRRLEHRVQVVGDEQTHRLPAADEERRAVAALAGARTLRGFDREVGRLLESVHARCAALFAGEEPLSSPFGSLIFTGVEDDRETLATLRRMGFSHPGRICEEIRAWHHGRIAATRSERGREAFTRLAPRLLEAAAATGAADIAFARFADFFVGLKSGVQVQSLLIARPALLELLVRIMAVAPRLAAQLARRPAALDILIDPALFDPIGDQRPLGETIGASASFEEAMDAARRLHREAAFRIAVQVLGAAQSARSAGAAFTDLARATIRGLAAVSLAEVERAAGPLAGEVAVVALGKCGSAEMTVSSDLDLMTLYHGKAGAVSARRGWSVETFFARFTQRLVAALSAPTAEGELYAVDLELRPSGAKGPVAVSLAAFEAYYEGEAETWELMALTRAQVVWATSEAFAKVAAEAVETALRAPRDIIATAREAREMRELMAAERPAAGAWDMKLAPGGLVDIEFCVQFLELAGAPAGGPLRRGTLEAIAALAQAGAAPAGDLDALAAAFDLQQTLSQLLKVALDQGADPSSEPKALRGLIAQAAGARRFSSVAPRLAAARKSVRRVFETLLPM